MVARYSCWLKSQKTVFATPKSISSGPPNPFSSRSPPRLREPDVIQRPILAPSKFGARPLANENQSSSAKSRIFLRPSLLSQVTTNGTTEPTTTASTFGESVSNSFLRVGNLDKEVAVSVSNGSKDPDHPPEGEIHPMSNNLFRTISTEVTAQSQVATSAATSNANPTFIFGQNLHERARVVEQGEKSEAPILETESSSSNGESHVGLLFSSAPALVTPAVTKSLTESAQEYEAARAAKRRYDEVEVFTGEEDETNVLQVHCKLHVFDKGLWAERGRGHLRLNDSVSDETTTSRIVMRCQGTLRIVLNTKVWPDMTVDRMSDKSIRVTGYDNGQIKIFLITASPKDADLLQSALEYRLATTKAHSQSKKDDEEEEKEEMGSKRRKGSDEAPEKA
ncbi:ran-binding protein 3-like isoform X2 [Artemia franciscana]|uniref:ran-binding protein 3-like isoform X2 n=1 Tax=Artemia franciscana TaxID=6661 RepID=UPI0032DBB992